jgi:hypothetical protein
MATTFFEKKAEDAERIVTVLRLRTFAAPQPLRNAHQR